MESEYGNVVYYTEVRWLSRGRMLKGVQKLKSEIELVLEMKGKRFLSSVITTGCETAV
jgi:hypothetical protein